MTGKIAEVNGGRIIIVVIIMILIPHYDNVTIVTVKL